MTDPTYHLEGVIKSRNEPGDFEGPLSLILMLLSKNKIEIRDIRISEILEQYLQQIDRMRKLDLEVASEFVQMASHLVYIKGKMLLASGQEVSELEELMTSLERLKSSAAGEAVRKIVPELCAMSEQGMRCFPTPGIVLPEYGDYSIRHTGAELIAALASALSRSASGLHEDSERPFAMPRRIAYPVELKAKQLLDLLASVGEADFSSLCAACGDRSELVAMFISVLELCAMGQICFFQGASGLRVKKTDEIPQETLDGNQQ